MGKKMEFLSYGERVGYRRGFRRGRVEGQIEGMREGLLNVLEIRFGKISEQGQATIESLVKLSALDELLTFAIKCRSLKSFESRLLKNTQRPTDHRDEGRAGMNPALPCFQR
jgi:hypothetical protein